MSAKKRKDAASPSDGGAEAAPPPEEPTFEDALARLEAIVTRLEDGEIPLEESVTAYAEGMRLVRHCVARLEAAEATVRELAEEGGGYRVAPSSLRPAEDGEDGEDDGEEA